MRPVLDSIPFALLIALAGCTGADAPATVADPMPISTAEPAPATAPVEAERAAAISVVTDPATPRILVDLRDSAADPQIETAVQQRILGIVFAAGIPADATVGGVARGAFTATGVQQEVALILPDGPRAAQPSATPPMLAVLEGDTVVTEVPLDAPYLSLPAATDIDGDRLDELFLRIDGLQMGQRFTSIHLISLKDQKADVLRRFDAARMDTCDNPAGAREVSAMVISLASGELQTREYRAPCSAIGSDGFRPITPESP